MNRKWLMTTLATGVVGILALGNGCYSYTPAPEGQTGTTFTERKLAESDKILSDIKVLTLKQAQEIAVMNNPTYISAYHAVNAARMSYYQALGAFSPTVSASFTMSRPESTYFNRHGNQANSNSFTTATGVQASWLIFDGFSRYFAAMAANLSRMEEDIRELMDKERESERTKNELITNVAHDLRTPLTSIIGYLELLSKGGPQPPEVQQKYIDIAYTKAKRLEKLIEELFGFTKMSCGKVSMNVGKVDIVKLLGQLLEEFYPSFADHHLTYELTSNVPAMSNVIGLNAFLYMMLCDLY